MFVKTPFSAYGKDWKFGEHFNWQERDTDPAKIAILYNSGFIYHNETLAVKERVGDRLNEMNLSQLETLVNLMNARIKKDAANTKESTENKIKQSRIEEKQRALVRRWLFSNPWANDLFKEVRDSVLKD